MTSLTESITLHRGGRAVEFPAGTECRVIRPDQLTRVSGPNEAGALRGCMGRMEESAAFVLIGGQVSCIPRRQLTRN